MASELGAGQVMVPPVALSAGTELTSCINAMPRTLTGPTVTFPFIRIQLCWNHNGMSRSYWLEHW